MDKERVKNIRELARIEAKLEQLREETLRDPELRELVRLRAWGQANPHSLAYEDGQIVSPSGWPGDVNPEEAMQELVQEIFGPPLTDDAQ